MGTAAALLDDPDRSGVRFVRAVRSRRPAGARIVTGSVDKTARVWLVFPTTRALVDYARSVKPRELTVDQRSEFFLK
jgi:hypothetical protein